jgi:hypothetical protein
VRPGVAVDALPVDGVSMSSSSPSDDKERAKRVETALK